MTEPNPSFAVATLAGGCFWCLEAVFERIRGVSAVTSGYCGGHLANPSYEQVCGGRTGHTEAVRIEFDPNVVSYRDLLEVFFVIHDPTTLNRQGNDVGTQYRSAIFWSDDAQHVAALAIVAELEAAQAFPHPIVTEINPSTVFYPAEAYHQGYYRAHPEQGYCAAIIAPKLAKFRHRFATLMA